MFKILIFIVNNKCYLGDQSIQNLLYNYENRFIYKKKDVFNDVKILIIFTNEN